MTVNSKECHFIRHALGLDQVQNKTGYRNRFFAGGEDISTGANLAAKGMAVRFQDDLFAITSSGFKAVRKAGERMDREEKDRFIALDKIAAESIAGEERVA